MAGSLHNRRTEDILRILGEEGICGDASPASDKRIYHDTLRLLRSYRYIAKALACCKRDLLRDLTALYGLSGNLDRVIAVLESFGDRRTVLRLERVRRMEQLTEYVNDAMYELKATDDGEKDFLLLSMLYMPGSHMRRDEIMSALRMSKSAYYRHHESAVTKLSVILWGTHSSCMDILMDVIHKNK